MAITNYGELKTAVAARAVRSDLTSLIPDFIRRAHDIIVSEMAVQADLTLDAATESLPTDFRQLIAVAFIGDSTTSLTQATSDQMTGLGTGKPYYYRVSGTTLYLAPTPSESYPAKVIYKLARTMFSLDADTNTALTRYPFMYLYGAMAELFAHSRNADEQSKYEALFRAEIDRANAAEREDAWPGALQPVAAIYA